MLSFKFDQSGKGNVWVTLILVAIIFGSYMLTGGLFGKPSTLSPTPSEQAQTLSSSQKSETAHSSLQLSTFTFPSCSQTAAVDFLIDNSGSMRFGEKMTELKKALHLFGNNFPSFGVVGIQTFSNTPSELLPFSVYKQVKTQYSNAVDAMFPDAGTYSKDAFVFAKQKILAAQKKFPDHAFTLIFISDGIPETTQTNIDCPGGVNGPICGVNPVGVCRCFDQNQDPTDVATQIKSTGVRVFAIAYTDTADAKFDNLLKSMMERLASSPSDFFTAPIASQVTDIIAKISTKLCKE